MSKTSNQFFHQTLYLLTLLSVLTVSGLAQQKQRGAGNVKKTQPTSTTNTTSTSNPEKVSKPTSASMPQNTIQPKARKKVIVVLEFDDASLSSVAEKRPLGRQLAILLSNEFSRRGNFTVIERLSIDKVIADQNRSFGGRYDQSKAAKIGKIFNAGTVVVGTITEYTTRKKATGIGGVYQKFAYSAKIGMAVRLVDVNTGEIQDSVTVDGAAIVNSSASGLKTTSTEMNDELKTSLFTEAANNAIEKAVTQLEKLISPDINNAPKANNVGNANAPTNESSTGSSLTQTNSSTETEKPEKKGKGGILGTGLFGSKKPKEVQTVEKGAATAANTASAASAVINNQPMIVQTAGTKVYVSNLSNIAKVGGEYFVVRVKNIIKDPQTGEILDTEYQEVAKIKITEVKEKVVIGEIISGSGVKALDLVKLKM